MTSPDLRKGGYYRFPDKPRASVTTICKVADSVPGAWYAKMAGEEAVRQLNGLLDSPTEYVARQDNLDYYGEDDRKFISNAARRYSEYAAEVGTAIHACIEADTWDSDKLWAFLQEPANTQSSRWDIIARHDDDRERVLDHILAHEQGYNDFMADYALDTIRREVTVYSTIHDYAGTLDLYARSDDGVVIVDWKTGSPKYDFRKKRVYPSVQMQMVAYGNADMMVDDHQHVPIEEFPAYAIVCGLSPKGYTAHRVDFDPAVFDAFLSLKRYFDVFEGER